jgi:ubiquinone/menaquinone biosynthesis C-methylase UbiE
MLQKFVSFAARQPLLLDTARWLLEGGFRGHSSVFRKELANSHGPLLDLGCGTGTHAARWPASMYTGLDSNPLAIATACRRCPDHSFICGDARRLPFAPDSFATIMICGVLHHLTDADVKLVLRECARVLQQRGQLIVWEDIPIQNPLNFIGAAVHWLDQGQFIRPKLQLSQLLETSHTVISERCFRSGFMDYTVYRILPQKLAENPAVHS